MYRISGWKFSKEWRQVTAADWAIKFQAFPAGIRVWGQHGSEWIAISEAHCHDTLLAKNSYGFAQHICRVMPATKVRSIVSLPDQSPMWMKQIVREDFSGISTGQHRQRADASGCVVLKHGRKSSGGLVRSNLDHIFTALS